jgi:hypothetical protein
MKRFVVGCTIPWKNGSDWLDEAVKRVDYSKNRVRGNALNLIQGLRVFVRETVLVCPALVYHFVNTTWMLGLR